MIYSLSNTPVIFVSVVFSSFSLYLKAEDAQTQIESLQ